TSEPTHPIHQCPKAGGLVSHTGNPLNRVNIGKWGKNGKIGEHYAIFFHCSREFFCLLVDKILL
ncbi:MAG: hypothetical protein JSW23_11245, partial [Planctomycetota bacterium]